MKVMFLICAFIIVSSVCYASSNELLTTDFYREIDPEIKKLVDYVHHEKFDKAIQIAESFIKRRPDHPVGYFFISAVYDTIIRDYGDTRYYPMFYNAVNKAIDLGSDLLKQAEKKGEPPDVWIQFYIGGSLGFRGLHRFFRNEWLSAFNDGINAVNHLKDCLKENPHMYDAYYGLGCFYYWKSAMARVLWFLPFIKDERDLGIEQLILAVRNGLYTNIEAKFALLRVYNNEKMYDNAIIFADDLMKEFPDNVFLPWQKAMALDALKKHREAADVYQHLIELYKTSSLHCFEKICEMAYDKVESLEEINDIAGVDETYNFIVEEGKRRELRENITRESSKYIQKIKKIKDRLDKNR